MCSRFTLQLSATQLADIFRLAGMPDLLPRFNIAPSQQIAVIRSLGGENRLDLMKWGLVPSWADDPAIGYRLLNARAETVFEKRTFRQAVRTRRCLIPATGFYEWRQLDTEKSPYYIGMADGSPMGFAGIWEHWKTPEGAILESCAILTTSANKLMEKIHDRMPVILHPAEYSLWLDREVSEPERLLPLCKPYPPGVMTTYPVSHLVNNPRNDTPDCILPLGATDATSSPEQTPLLID